MTDEFCVVLVVKWHQYTQLCGDQNPISFDDAILLRDMLNEELPDKIYSVMYWRDYQAAPKDPWLGKMAERRCQSLLDRERLA